MRSRLAVSLLIFWLHSASPHTATGEPSSQRLQEADELHQERFGHQRTLEEHLEPWVRGDAGFNTSGGRDALVPHLRAVYDGLHVLLSDALRTQFLGLSSDSLRGEWLRRYWVLRDPTPTTPENEFRDEHRRRVQAARRHFRHDDPPGWDDRGVFMILYGPPRAVSNQGADVRAATGYTPAREYWYYDDGVIVPFELHDPNGSKWVFGISAQKFSSRSDLLREARHGQYALALGYGPRPTMFDEDRAQMHDVDPLNAIAIALSQAAASELLEERRERIDFAAPLRPPLWFVLDTDAFGTVVGDARPRHVTRLEAHIQVSLADLDFEALGGSHVARLGVEGALLDADLSEVARDAYEATFEATSRGAAGAKRLVPGQLNFHVEPGAYRLAVRVVDLTSTAEGRFTTDVAIPALAGPQLQLSDIELATAIVAPELEATRFVKRGRAVLPHPLAAYQNSDELTAYFEIYGLQLAEDASARYRISYQIVSKQRRRHEGWFPRAGTTPLASVTSSFTASTKTKNPIQELRVDTSSLQPATYDLIITVQDLVSTDEATTSTIFSIIRN